MSKFSNEQEQPEKGFSKEQRRYESEIANLKVNYNLLRKENKELLSALELAFSLLEENLPSWYLRGHYIIIRETLDNSKFNKINTEIKELIDCMIEDVSAIKTSIYNNDTKKAAELIEGIRNDIETAYEQINKINDD